MTTPLFEKYIDQLVPAIIQDHQTHRVLMLGFMNAEAYQKTQQTNRVHFYSRSKKRLWMKGETSGNILTVQQILLDCDADTLLITAIPKGPVCHTGQDTCFGETNASTHFLNTLEQVIEDRMQAPSSASYVSGLQQKGINKMAQKLGEEAIELVIEAKDDNQDLFENEAADLLFHYLILLKAKKSSLQNIVAVLENRHAEKK